MFETSATASSKDAGDDPDITNGMKVVANIAIPFRIDDPLPEDTPQDDYNIIVCGGEGVGVVTMPGLGLELGSSAINDTPREMIKKNVKPWLERLHIAKQPNPILITISIPGGEEIAKRTFNPRLGIEGGISIIGTSGIVKPFSSKPSSIPSGSPWKWQRQPGTLVSSSAPAQRANVSSRRIIPTSLPRLSCITATLSAKLENSSRRASTARHPRRDDGKAVKLAEGNLDTHSKKVTANKEFIQDLARQTGCSEETLAAIGQMNWRANSGTSFPKSCWCLASALIELCHRHCALYCPMAN